MTLVVAALAVLLLSGAASLALGRKGFAAVVAVGGAVAAAALGIIPAACVLPAQRPSPFRFRGASPAALSILGSTRCRLSSPRSSLPSRPSPRCTAQDTSRGTAPPHRLARTGSSITRLTASMLVVVTAQNAVLFLVAWECMALVVVFPRDLS